MPKNIQVPGVGVVQFPDGMSDADINTELDKQFAPKNNYSPQMNANMAASSARNASPTQFEQDRNPANQPGTMMSIGHELKGMIPSMESFGSTMNPAKAQQVAQGMRDDDQARKDSGRSLPYRALAQVAGQFTNVKGMEQAADVGNKKAILGIAAADAAPAMLPVTEELGGAALRKIPSAARAGEAFGEVMKAAGQVPIDTVKVGNTALEVQRMAKSGGAMPKVVNDFLRRVTDPAKPPMTYEEARNFYSNATRISADEMNRLTPVMKRQLGQFTADLGESIAGAADDAGKLPQYQAAMKEYRQAMKLRGYSDKVIDLMWKSAAGAGTAGAGIYAAKKILE